MREILFIVLLLALLMVSPADGYSSLKVMGYAPVDYYGDNMAFESLIKYEDYISDVAVFAYTFDKSGNLHGYLNEDILGYAKSHGIRPIIVINNLTDNFDQVLADSVLKNSYARRNLISNILKVLSKGYAGVNIDIENLSYAQRSIFNSFLTELKSQLNGKYMLSVAIPAITHDSPDNNWSGGFDYAKIGEIADEVILMTYDEHWFKGEPGPIASYPWVEKALNYAISKIPKEKILLGVANYGYDWASTGNKVVTADSVKRLQTIYGGKIYWSDYYKEAYYQYEDGVKHQVWFENEYSLKYKLDLARKLGIEGVALWRLGFESDAYMKTLKGMQNQYGVPYGYLGFSDILNDWAIDEINYLKYNGIVDGDGGRFYPNYRVTRAEFIKMLVKALKIPLKESTYPDTRNHWADKYIGAAQDAKIIYGAGDGNFYPNSYLTRAQMAAIMTRALKLPVGHGHCEFKDIENSWARDDIIALYSAGLINGYNKYKFAPDDETFRNQAAAIITKGIRLQK